jgi:hypothetical protein
MRCATRPPIRDAFGGVSPFGRRRVRRQHDVLSRGLSFQPLNLRGKVAGAPTLSRAPARAKGRPGAGSSSGGLTSSDPLPADLAAARAMILRRADGATRSRVAGAARRGSDARGLSGSEYVSSAPRMLWRRGRDLDQAAAWRADPDVRYLDPAVCWCAAASRRATVPVPSGGRLWLASQDSHRSKGFEPCSLCLSGSLSNPHPLRRRRTD